MDEADDADLDLDRASASLLHDLQQSLSIVLFKRGDQDRRQAHSVVRQRDLDHLIKLIEPFQSDPQLLDTHLKDIVPQTSDALLQHLSRESKSVAPGQIDLADAASTLLYTLCKVRGRKVVSGLLQNAPRHLELIITSLERRLRAGDWQTQYSLLIWLAHLLLAPFSLDSISLPANEDELPAGLALKQKLPDLAHRSIRVCLTHIGSPTVSRDIAALVLVRLATRPDMQKLQLADALVDWSLDVIATESAEQIVTLHLRLGVMHFLAGLAKSADLNHLLPRIFQACERISSSDANGAIITDAVGRKLLLKTMSAVMMTSLRAASNTTILARLLDESGALEATIENQFQSLADRESLVRNAAAKATSNIISKLEAEMAREVLEALFSMLHDDMARDTLQTANAFAWHGVVLTLSYALFKRCVPTVQLASVIGILLRALTFEQRTATGSTTGTNIRDAANFGLWSLARRSTTSELVQTHLSEMEGSLIQIIAIQLLQTACLDPTGNVRRGSSAALQELVGRHPDQITSGIALVQVVDFVAVGLRRRAMVEVAARAMLLDRVYFDPLINGLIGWRGLGASDAASREFAAASVAARLQAGDQPTVLHILSQLTASLRHCRLHDVETLHGLTLTFALWINNQIEIKAGVLSEEQQIEQLRGIWTASLAVGILDNPLQYRAARTKLGLAVVKLVTAYCRFDHWKSTAGRTAPELDNLLPALLDQLLVRSDDAYLQLVAELVPALLPEASSTSRYISLHLPHLIEQLNIDIVKPSQHGAARAIAVGVSIRQQLSHSDVTQCILALQMVCQASYIDWRILGFKAILAGINRPHERRTINGDNLRLLISIITHGFRDFTIDQRGDVGSLVRLEALACADVLCTAIEFELHPTDLEELHAGIGRLSLEKLNRVRVSAARCRSRLTGPLALPAQTDEVDSQEYFNRALAPLWVEGSAPWVKKALVAGLPSCAGTAAEHLTQNCRSAMSAILSSINITTLQQVVEELMDLLISATAQSHNLVPILIVVEYLLQAHILQRLVNSDFKWRRLLAQVQKSHYKSTDIPRLLTAVSIYACLSDVQLIRQDVLKKLFSMLKTIPYPKVRAASAEALYLATSDEALKDHDWHLAAARNADVLTEVLQRSMTT